MLTVLEVVRSTIRMLRVLGSDLIGRDYALVLYYDYDVRRVDDRILIGVDCDLYLVGVR